MFILLCFQNILCSQNNNNMRKPTPYDLSAYLYQQSLTPQTQLPDTGLQTPALPPTTEVPPEFQQTFVFPSTTYAGAGSLAGPFSQTPMLTAPAPQLYQQPTISPNLLDGNTFIQGDQACAFYDGQPCFDSSAGLPRPRARVTRVTTPSPFVQEDSPLPMDYMDYRDCMQPGPSTSGIQPSNIPQNIIDEESYLDSDDDPDAEYEIFPFKSHDPSKYIDRPGLILQPETQVYETADEYPDNSYKHLYDSDNFKFDISGNSYNVNLGVRGFPEEYIPFQPPETLSIVNDKKYRDLIRKAKKDAVEIDGSTLYGHDEFIEKEGSADTKDLMNHVECLIESNADSSYAKSLAMRIELKQAVKAKNIKRENILTAYKENKEHMSEEYTELLDRAIEGEILIEGTRLYNESLKDIYNIQKELINTHDIEKKKKLEREIVSLMKETYNNRAKLCKESQQLVGNPELLRSEINRLERLSK